MAILREMLDVRNIERLGVQGFSLNTHREEMVITQARYEELCGALACLRQMEGIPPSDEPVINMYGVYITVGEPEHERGFDIHITKKEG